MPTTPAPPAPAAAFGPATVRFALLGLILGLFGLGISAYGTWLQSEPKPKVPLSERMARAATKAVEKLQRAPAEPDPPAANPSRPWTRGLGLASSVLGLLAVAGGCASWLAHEPRRWTASALGLGLIVLAWSYVVVAVGIAVAILVLFVLL